MKSNNYIKRWPKTKKLLTEYPRYTTHYSQAKMVKKVQPQFCCWSLSWDTVCKRRKLKVNVKKTKVMLFPRSKSELVDFHCLYRVRVECLKRCEIS